MVDDRHESPAVTGLNPTKIPVPHAAKMLTRAGGAPVTEAMIESDLAAGAPANADGTLNLVHYAAWLVREMANRD